MNGEKLVYRIVIMESIDNRARYTAHVFSGDQVIDRAQARTMATLCHHVRNIIGEHYATPTKQQQPKANQGEAPKPKQKASKKPTATTAPVVETTAETNETEATE